VKFENCGCKILEFTFGKIKLILGTWCRITHVMELHTMLQSGHCMLWYNWNARFLLITWCKMATHLAWGQTNSMVSCQQGQILLYLETTNWSVKVRQQNKKQIQYIRLGFILERCSDVQRVQTDRETETCPEGEGRSLSGSTCRRIAECVFGMDLTAMGPVTMMVVCSFILHWQDRMVYCWDN
jgi:hypothetical protein